MRKVKRIVGIIAILLQTALIPFFIEMNNPGNMNFPQGIANDMTIDKKNVPWKLVKGLSGTRRENSEGYVTVYLFIDQNGKIGQEIYGSESWNASIFYDFDSDGLEEFFVRQHDVFTGVGGPVISVFKYKNNKYIFWKIINRNELPIYLDYKFFGFGYWAIIYILEIVVLILSSIWIILWGLMWSKNEGVSP